MANPYGWGTDEPQIKPKDQGGDTIATFSQKVYNLFDKLFDTLNSYPWSAATQSDTGYMSAADKTALDNIVSTGTWTPVFSPASGGAASLTVTDLNASYVKVGRLVECWVACTITASSSASGALRLECSSLPFARGNDFIEGRMLGVPAASIPYISNSRIYNTVIMAGSNLQVTEFTSGLAIRFGFLYLATS